MSENISTFPFENIGEDVKINKFPGAQCLCRKDKLCKNYKKMRQKFGEANFDFIPESYNLSEDLEELEKNKKENDVYIMKPPAQSCGNGIKLVTDFSLLPSRSKNLVIQKYLKNPLLIDGLKFDLRLYVLMTGVDPLKIYLYEDGLVRFATRYFTMNPVFFSDNFRHLTNFSVNKYNPEFQHNEDPSKFYGHKRSFKRLLTYLSEKGFDTTQLKRDIEEAIIKTLMTGYSEMLEEFSKRIRSEYNCYKLFGVDVILDESLKPWILEFNDFPSLGKLENFRFLH